MKQTGITDTVGWLKTIMTWALLGLAANQFMDLKNTVKEMHQMVIRHDERLNKAEDEINRLRDAPKLSQRSGPWNSGSPVR